MAAKPNSSHLADVITEEPPRLTSRPATAAQNAVDIVSTVAIAAAA